MNQNPTGANIAKSTKTQHRCGARPVAPDTIGRPLASGALRWVNIGGAGFSALSSNMTRLNRVP